MHSKSYLPIRLSKKRLAYLFLNTAGVRISITRDQANPLYWLVSHSSRKEPLRSRTLLGAAMLEPVVALDLNKTAAGRRVSADLHQARFHSS